MAELADAHGSGPCGRNTLWVRLPSSAVQVDGKLDEFSVYFTVAENELRDCCKCTR